jgi:putative ATP-binding cassette transporter
MAGLAGLSNALIIAMINSGAQSAAAGSVSLWAATVFIISLLLYIRTQLYILSTTTVEVEAAIHRLRLRLMNDVRNSELLPLEAVGRSEIVAGVTKETQTLTQAATVIVMASQATVLIFFTALYVAYLSVVAFAMSTLIVVFAAVLYLARGRNLRREIHDSLQWENRLFERLTDLLDGFKEVRLNAPRSDDLYEDIKEVSSTAANLKIQSQTDGLKQYIFSQTSFYVLLGAMVFVVPTFSQTLGSSMIKTTTALLFIIGSISSVVSFIPLSTAEMPREFKEIELRDVRFNYVDKRSDATFRVGPASFALRPGEIVFIAGGNGSGKSTFLKLLTSLYRPDSGEILLDGVPVTSSNQLAYRNLFTAVFSDYHLFKQLYGIADADPAEVNGLLALFELTGKTSLMDGQFTTLDLSAGQRKRLALIVALLEKRPVLVLDEWTADQDPEFRKKFYHELIPILQQSGRAVVAVTHDDRYLSEFALPARKLRMDDGRFVDGHPVENG